MQVSTKAIVLSKIRYQDHDLIVKCYTRDFGIKSYLLKNILKSKKGNLKPAYFQLFSLLEIEADHRENRSLQYIRDVKVGYKTETIHTQIIKSSIVIFLAEITSNILKEEEQNFELYDFIATAIQWFEAHETNRSFHFQFLIELTKYLGFYPELKQDAPYFNLLEGKFQGTNTDMYCISGENLIFLKTLLGIKFDDNIKLNLNTNQKRDFLDMILTYFKLHLDGFKEPKSLVVLNQVFN
ncbi:MAG: DNA repair protein RecO [Bacteroidia bacterium]|nr:DNA repair protein RecO [Bacteroidia bacterium]MBT8277805.1 DNA repair protein RecO [Bacteroidia bacterium]NND26902.1 DNA repair protein RecO [Flavobacteriaceae bacterium]NNK61179.1 DNA repair protein RecO [Flavobacteriaceae bacterium]NNL32214.1 DNA repair protein RecO [Flavobacteriaceae bacterium]